ncbi:MAG: tyrosine--tRNA ligase [Nanoarchaeales archaeon]|nr:tyrosine--tRNA ligase [Nanoarchaeales archaeon]
MTKTIDEKIELINQVGEEVINDEDLRKLLENKKEQIIAYDGFEPSGQIHIAQGLLKAINVNKLTSCGIKYKMFVADYFAMLNNKYGGDLEKIQTAGKYFIEVWKSSGMNLENVEFVWAKEFYDSHPEYWETVLKLSMNATVSRVLKCGQVMGREDNTSNPASQIMYPIMQAADIIHLGADIAQLGMDQRKVNMLARDIFPKIKKRKPVCVHHHMLMGLQYKVDDNMSEIDRKIAMKMSKSKPETAIFMTDSAKDVSKKFNKATSVDGVSIDNPILEYFKYIIFEKYDTVTFERPEQYGGLYKVDSYEQLVKEFEDSTIKSGDLKQMAAKYINELLEPTRLHFKENENAKQLLEKVKSYNVTR